MRNVGRVVENYRALCHPSRQLFHPTQVREYANSNSDPKPNRNKASSKDNSRRRSIVEARVDNFPCKRPSR